MRGGKYSVDMRSQESEFVDHLATAKKAKVPHLNSSDNQDIELLQCDWPIKHSNIKLCQENKESFLVLSVQMHLCSLYQSVWIYLLFFVVACFLLDFFFSGSPIV